MRFLFGFPFALLFLAVVLAATGDPLPRSTCLRGWTLVGALTQIAATALMLMTMERRSFVVTTAYLKTEPILVAIMGLLFLGDRLTRHGAAIALATAGVVLISVKPESLEHSVGKHRRWACPPAPCLRLRPSAIGAPFWP